MAQSLTSSIKISATGALTDSPDLGSIGYNLSYTTPNFSFANGTSANQANQIWTDTRTITASSSENLDLAGVLANALGTTLTFTRIKAIIINAASGNTNNVLVGGHASAAFSTMFGDATDVLVVRPGGSFCLVAPDATAYAVTATTGDLLKIANSGSGTSVTYDIILIGCV